MLEGAEEEITTVRKYSQVKPVYKIGCRGCDTHEFTPQLCTKCKEAAKTVDITYIVEMIKKLEEVSFPNMVVDDVITGSNSSTGIKRSLDDENDEINAKNQKNNGS